MNRLTAKELASRELVGLEVALQDARLPADDLYEDGRRFFAFLQDEKVIGYAGAELWDGGALLRSLVVMPEFRGFGHSRAIITWMVKWLTEQGHRDLWLLTTTAQGLMGRFGFDVAAREEAPPPVQASRQFSGLCPASAVLMRRKGD